MSCHRNPHEMAAEGCCRGQLHAAMRLRTIRRRAILGASVLISLPDQNTQRGETVTRLYGEALDCVQLHRPGTNHSR